MKPICPGSGPNGTSTTIACSCVISANQPTNQKTACKQRYRRRTSFMLLTENDCVVHFLQVLEEGLKMDCLRVCSHQMLHYGMNTYLQELLDIKLHAAVIELALRHVVFWCRFVACDIQVAIEGPNGQAVRGHSKAHLPSRVCFQACRLLKVFHAFHDCAELAELGNLQLHLMTIHDLSARRTDQGAAQTWGVCTFGG